MLNYELVRAVHLDRERDVQRAVRHRSLRAVPLLERVVPPVDRPAAEDAASVRRLAPSRSR